MTDVVAAIDLGTNSTRLLVHDGERVLDRLMTITRLGQDVDRTGRLADEAIAKGVVHVTARGRRGEDVARRRDVEIEAALDVPQEVGREDARCEGGALRVARPDAHVRLLPLLLLLRQSGAWCAHADTCVCIHVHVHI